MQKIKYKILPIILLLFSTLLVFCACTPGNNNDDDKNSESGGGVVAAAVEDIYYANERFCYKVAPSSGELTLKSFITINGVREELESSRFDGDGESFVVLQYVNYKIKNCTAPKFTISAYTENEDGSSKSQEKVVEFDNKKIIATLDRTSGKLSWPTDEIFASYTLSVRASNTTQVFDYPTNTTGIFEVYDVFDRVETDKFALTIEPNMAEGIDIPKTTYYSDKKTIVYVGRQTINSVNYNNGCISWRSSDNELFETELGATFEIKITDGDQTITQTITTDQDGYNEFFYLPNNENFSFTVSGGIDYEWIVKLDPVVCTPVCVGKVSNISVTASDALVWDFDTIPNFAPDGDVMFDIMQDDELVETLKYKMIFINGLNTTYGDTSIKIVPRFYKSNHYACATTMEMFFGKKADLKIVDYDTTSVKLKLLDIDSNATAYRIYSAGDDFSQTLEDVYEGMEYIFTPTTESTYLYIEPVYANEENVIVKKTYSAQIEVLKDIQYEKVNYITTTGSWDVKFQIDDYTNQAVECYMITTEKPDGEKISVSCTEMKVSLPADISDYEDTKEIKLKLRYTPSTSTERYVQLSGGYKEYVFKNLPMPEYSYTENNKLIWEYTTDLEYKDFTLEFYKNYYTNPSLIARKSSNEAEFDLSQVHITTGDVFVNIYANAKLNNVADNVITLSSSREYVDQLHKFDVADVYAIDQNRVFFKHNWGQGSYANGVKNIRVRLYTDENEEIKNFDNETELNIREYLTDWQVDEVKADVVIEGGPAYINSDVKTVTIKSSTLDGFMVSNEYGTISFNKFLTNSTYDYDVYFKLDGDTEYTIFESDTGVSDTEIAIKENIETFMTGAPYKNRYFENFKVCINTNVSTNDLKGQRSSEIVTLAPLETVFEFYGLTYGVSKKEAYKFGFNFNKEFDTDPRITAITTDGTTLGAGVLSENGSFNFSALGEGTHTIVFTNNIADSVLDSMYTFNLPYYHTLIVRGKETPRGQFINFKKGTYYYEPNDVGSYVLNQSKSTPATVDFVVGLGDKLIFDGEVVNLSNGRYTMNLLKSNDITLSVSATSGLQGAHTYNKYTYTDEEVLSYQVYTTPTPQSLNVKNGILNIQVSRYDADAYYNVWFDGAVYGTTQTFTKDTVSAKDTYDPSEGTNLPKFSPGQELTIVISRNVEGDTLEADIVIEYTVPNNN